ncbi:MAG: hypothetical protein A2X82_11655 [Geobacteraceae bacterium GWC2_55_20]|nr:MAG: hypothetical protein A2X82_11655 [Geobacteraceae bacterium GWC2_55_20]OGU23349.1 MAG: hypothetical protein A2X85_17760 [Geobacteraceae bacterium GWF2_54_21]HCE66869.1 hypothetical protein [Geobacter sp.]
MGDWLESANEYESNALLSLKREDYDDAIYWLLRLKNCCHSDIIEYGLGVSYFNLGYYETAHRHLYKINIDSLYRLYNYTIFSKEELLNIYAKVRNITKRDNITYVNHDMLDDSLLRSYQQLYDTLRKKNMSYSSEVVFDIFLETLHIIHFFAIGRDIDDVINIVNSRQEDNCEPASYDYIISTENIYSSEIVTLHSIYKAKFDELNRYYQEDTVIDMFNIWIEVLLVRFNRSLVK